MYPQVARSQPQRGLPKLAGYFCLLALLGSAALSMAESLASAPATAPDGSALLPSGIEIALDRKDFRKAQALLEQAYRLERRPLFLLLLARIHVSLKLPTEAADYYRRYRDSVDPEHTDRDSLRETETYLQSFSAPVAELQVRGPVGEFLYVGSRLIGVLPLPGTVLLPPGEYAFALEVGKLRRTTKEPVTLSTDRLTVLLLESLDDRTLHKTIQYDPRWLLRLETNAALSMQQAIWRAAATYASEGRNVLVSSERVAEFVRQQPGLSRCIEKRDCRSPLISHTELAYVFFLRVLAPPGSANYEMQLSVLDIETRAELGPFDGQSAAATVAKVSVDLMRQAVSSISERSRGRIAITSQPPGAQVWQGERLLDVTPYRQAALVGAQTFRLIRSGYLAQDVAVQVEPNGEAISNITLTKTPWAGIGGRPLWRLALGGTLLLGGVLAGGFGVSALVANGTCYELQPNDGFCPYLNTSTIGTALLTTGAALTATGSLLAFWPARRRER